MKKALPKRRCRQCGKLFPPKRAWQEYDSTKCRKAAFDERRAELLRRAEEIVRSTSSEAEAMNTESDAISLAGQGRRVR